MKNYTQNDAMKMIFESKKAKASPKMLVYKIRYKKNTLSQKSINTLLVQHGFSLHTPATYTHRRYTQKRFPHINKAKYVSIAIDVKTYNRVVRVINVGDGGTSDIEVAKWYLKRLQKDNEFVRLKCKEYYIDIRINSFKEIPSTIPRRQGTIIISLGDIIDSNNLSRIIVKQNDRGNNA